MDFTHDKVLFPSDIKKMSDQELNKLADEIRKFMITNVSKTGGHLASNLGIVELSIALHRVFNTPTDKIIWDVGHQSYVHKILTGRAENFDTLRTLNGLSGFPKRSESAYDVFDSGHSSNSISAALGLAVARDLKGESNAVIAVIGDGALTGGMVYEALNNAGCLQTKLIVVLNDNDMSISKNLGSMAQHLSSLRSSEKYNRFKANLKRNLKKIPRVGDSIYGGLETIRDTVKYAVISEGVIFEELGFKYIGPIDGHNIADLTDVLKGTLSINSPVFVHVVTQKGKGYTFAERKPDKFHGIGPFDPKTGELRANNSGAPTYSEVFGEKMIQIAEGNHDVVAVSAAMIQGTGLEKFYRKYPNRIFDVGIAEAHAVTFASGIALQGMRPVVAIYSTFLQRAYDQIMLDVCLQGLPVIFAIDRAGIVGNDGETHNGVFDISYLLPMPNMIILSPSSGAELRTMLDYALAQNAPVAVRYPKGTAFETDSICLSLPPLPQAAVYKEGHDVTVIAAGKMFKNALGALEILNNKGINVELIDPRILKPMDEETIIKSALKTGLVITIEDNVVTGGFGCAVDACLQKENCTDVRMVMLGWPDKFIQHGCINELEKLYGLDPAGIAEKVSEAVERKA